MAAAVMDAPVEEKGAEGSYDDGPQDVHGSDPIVDLIVDGGGGQLSFAVGGKKPTTSTVKLVGGKLEVNGQFEKGERVVLRVECEVREIAFVNQVDAKTQQTVGCDRRHKLAITGVDRLD